MKIIIAGDGKVGAALTGQLSAEGYDLTLIDTNQKVLEGMVEKYDCMAVTGNCASMAVLEQANVKETDLLIAATSADEINLLCCMTAHGMNRNLHTIARIRNPEYTDQIFEMRNLFALSMTVNPEKQAAVEIERLLKFPGFRKRDTFAKGRVEIVEVRIDANSHLRNLALNEIYRIVGVQVLVCTILRSGKAIVPDGNFIIREGDRLFVTASTNNLASLLKNLGILSHKVKHVMLCGGGRVSYYLAERLQKSGMQVQIIEQNYDRCLELAANLPYADIIHGDAGDQTLLESEGIDRCDAFITLTGIDEQNMILSMYANSRGVPMVVTKVGHVDNTAIMDSLQLGSIVSPKELCSNSIVRYVRAMRNQTGAARAVHTIADGQMEALEFRVDEDTRNCGIPLKNLKLKKNILIVCITHGGKTQIPNGDSEFKLGDTVIVVRGQEHMIYQLNDIFE